MLQREVDERGGGRGGEHVCIASRLSPHGDLLPLFAAIGCVMCPQLSEMTVAFPGEKLCDGATVVMTANLFCIFFQLPSFRRQLQW